MFFFLRTRCWRQHESRRSLASLKIFTTLPTHAEALSVTSANLTFIGSLTVSAVVSANGNVVSSSTTSGSLVVSGGLCSQALFFSVIFSSLYYFSIHYFILFNFFICSLMLLLLIFWLLLTFYFIVVSNCLSGRSSCLVMISGAGISGNLNGNISDKPTSITLSEESIAQHKVFQ